jgi:hypothetical protein
MSQKYDTIPKIFYIPLCPCKIWLRPLVDYHQTTYLTKLKPHGLNANKRSQARQMRVQHYNSGGFAQQQLP